MTDYGGPGGHGAPGHGTPPGAPGQGFGGYGGYVPPPRIDPAELRPRRRWYWIAAAFAAVLVGTGIVLFVTTLTGAVDSVDKEGRFESGGSLSLELGKDEERAVFVDEKGGAFRYQCRATGPGGSDPSLTRPGSSFHVTNGDHYWQRVLVLKAKTAGTHEVTCRATRSTEFAVGEKPEFGGFMGRIALTVLLPLLGVLAAAAVMIVTGVRRGRHKRRLRAERAYPGGYGGPPPGYAGPPPGFGGPPQGPGPAGPGGPPQGPPQGG